MRRHRNAKIIATLGPTSADPDTVHTLFKAGADVFRLNLSHGSHADHSKSIAIIRELEAQIQRPIGILLDLQGPKFRIGRFASGPVGLAAGDHFRLDLNPEPGDSSRVQLPHPEILDALEVGADVLLNDGNIRLKVVRSALDFADTEVVVGGYLSDSKGVNVPGVMIQTSPLTAKDHVDLEFGLQQGVDWIALSFVQQPSDIDELRERVGSQVKLMAKLEKPSAISNLDAIVERADAIMVARGDLGVELPPEQIPRIQKRILRVCRKAGRPVVVATQMLESMISSPTPTRAEASDVATAVYDGADAVMLSAETAVGKYPIAAVTFMDNIIAQVEHDPYYREVIDAAAPVPEATNADAICVALRNVTQILPIAVTVTYTHSGYSTLRAARERPASPLISITPYQQTARFLTLVWGVHSVIGKEISKVSHVVKEASKVALDNGFARRGQPLVIAAGMPFGIAGTTNFLRIAWID